ncbi:restriction endonuclease subunit S [Pseudomonas hefeiensis]|uniref:Restriction endonuclease subunit S n=1 Tax=Pseudomonas hefeiensis TaxID=2738125 RepID=A0ABY9GD13_9PSED|nr:MULTISPECIES: restriction endonuclease subunit S [unclassified Pseudomonas]WLH13412.1 restriction endonuclease subunit S [Pseudomonas sp. FP205]WLH96469.1 restriction endonuclease subunit S [Pseudomonas sp. FP53]WLI40747.1 restriction endonuclease subunit S [Pseudomonas sp. FP821]
MTFPCYPEYRESGVEWLGEVPKHWCSVPIKYMALERKSLFLDGDWIESKDISSEGIRYITTGNVGEGVYKEQGAGFISEETFHSLSCTEVHEGDVLISRLNNPIGRACVAPDLGGRVVTSVDNVIFRPDSKYHKKFIVYLFSSEEYFKHTGNLARGATMQRISRGLLGNIRVVTPSLTEQTQIARFLDYETARIHALIEEQQRLIELLKEKRQALISQAVTKGLNPTMPMKDSGVEWLGEVPAHWKVKQLKHVVDPSTSITYGIVQAGPEFEGGIPYIRTSDMSGEELPVSGYPLTSPDIDESYARSRVRPGDIVMSIRASVGKCLPVPNELKIANLTQGTAKISVGKQITRNFLLAFLNAEATQNYFDLMAKGATFKEITLDALRRTPVPLPPENEQIQIDQFVSRHAGLLDETCKQAIESISLLQERRTALISAAVTGKIDVRGWQPPVSKPSPELAQEAV